MRIVEARSSDANLVGSIHSMAWKETYENIFEREYLAQDTVEKRRQEFMDSLKDINTRYFLLYDSEVPIGIMKIRVEKDCCEIESLYLLKSCRGKGSGTQAIQFVINEFSNVKIALWTLEINESARKFYEKNGFCDTGERRVIARGKDFVQMRYEYLAN